MAKASAPSGRVDPQADRERTRIRNAGRRRMSVGMMETASAQAAKDVQRVRVVGAGHLPCSGEYHAVRVPPDGSIVVAFANNLGYRLVLRERHAQPSVWEILMAEGHNDVLYASDNVYGHLPPVNEWRVVMGETPEPALKEITMDEPREEPMQNDGDD